MNLEDAPAAGTPDAPRMRETPNPGDAAGWRAFTERVTARVGEGDPLQILAESPGDLALAIAHADDHARRTPEHADGWSVAQVLAHLADAEVVFGVRLRQVLTRETPPLEAFDQDAWATRGSYAGKDPESSLREFRTMRTRNLALWRSLTPAEWDRGGVHADRGFESLRQIVRIIAGHDLAHRAQVRRILMATVNDASHAGIHGARGGAPEWRLRRLVLVAEHVLSMLPEEQVRAVPASGSWSRAQILGHLVDSASNNHQRFVRAALDGQMRFAGYAQDRWVALPDYATLDWTTLLESWGSLNRVIARVMAAVPAPLRREPRPQHNVHEVAFKPWPSEHPATLEWFFADYVDHLEHHLRQIAGDAPWITVASAPVSPTGRPADRA